MGCCLFACISAIWPRVGLLILWVFNLAPIHFKTWYWPVLGFLFFPTTTLCYQLLIFFRSSRPIQDSPFAMILIGLAVLHDLGQLGMFKRRRERHE